MSCAVCGEPTRDTAIVIRAPQRLAGRQACARCGPPLDALADGRLSRAELEEFIRHVELNGSQTLIPELRRAQADGAAAPTAASPALLPVLAAIATTSGFDIEGQRIVAHLGFVSSEVVVGLGLFSGISADLVNVLGAESDALTGRLAEAKDTALLRLRRQVHARGGNGIIGIRLDHAPLGASLVGVFASGTAVLLEPVTTWQQPR